MGWFFGCFGCGKKDRRHGTPSSSLPKQKKPLHPLPVRIPAASSSIPINAFPVQEGLRHKDHFTVRQFSSSVPVRRAEWILQDGADSRTPETQKKLGPSHPWCQLDELEEQLEDLRKQINKESQDAPTIREEVTFLKSCGTLVKTPSELRKTQQPEQQRSSVSEGGWHSWLVPSSSPTSRTLLEKKLQIEGLKAALCEPTPAKECHGILHGVQTPVSNKKTTQSNLHHSLQAGSPTIHGHDERFDNIKKDKGESSDALPIYQSDTKLSSPANFKSFQKGLNSTASPDSQELFDISDDLLRSSNGPSKQDIKSLLISENTSAADATEIENNLTKKRRLGGNATSIQEPQAPKQPLKSFKIDVGGEDHASSQKRLKIVPSADHASEDIKAPSMPAAPLQMHFFRCDTLDPIIESGASNDESTSYDSKSISKEPVNHRYNSYGSTNSASQSISQSSSMSATHGYPRQSPASETKSVSFASTYDGNYTTDEMSYGDGTTEERYSGESYTNSSCVDDRNEEDELANACYSPSKDSEETVGDFSPEHCFSPPISHSQEISGTLYKGDNSSASIFEEEPAAKHHSCVSSQYSSVCGGGKRQQASRYDNEENGKTEDDYEFFTDAMSHVSTECSEKDHRMRHGHTDSMESVTIQFAQLGHAADLNSIDTPLKLPEWLATPSINGQGLAGKPSRLRSKPASSVLTPVENVSQWKQLKKRDHKPEVIIKTTNEGLSKTEPSLSMRAMFGYNVVGARKENWDEDKHAAWTPGKREENSKVALQGEPICVNSSLSHWGAISGAEPICVDNSLSHWGIALEAEPVRVDMNLPQWSMTTTEAEPVRVDTSLSHWLRSSSKHIEAYKSKGSSSTTTSSSGGGGVISPDPQLYTSPSSMIAMQGHHSHSYVTNERPILGASSGDYSSAKKRSPWDGQGIPNSTAKYKEDQKVNWHTTPFELRLEKALDKQGTILQKKLFEVTPTGF